MPKNNVQTINETVTTSNQTGLNIKVIKAENDITKYKVICDLLKQNIAVIVNFENTDKIVMRRMLDTLNGACCAVEGMVQTLSPITYLVAPKTVNVSDVNGLGDI